MKDTAKNPASQAPSAMPGFQQVIALALTKADADLQRIIETRSVDEHWDDADTNVDFSIELALTHIDRMKTMTFDTADGFCYEWFKAGGAVHLALHAFSRPNCAYFRMLEGLSGMFAQIAGFVEFSEKTGV